MDSYNYHFERMSNIDLHPLSLPMSRLSPAKSNSSIADQFVHHHQHGKGDSAYSSFSGGSTAPDYPSPFLPEDLHYTHYADLKYVKSFYNPSQVLQSDPKTMDQLYRSVEAISQQYRHSNSNLNHYNRSESGCANNKTFSKQDTASQAGFITHNPPPIPTRLDSFIATKNLENTRAHHESQQLQLQSSQQKLETKQEGYKSASQPPSYHLHHLTNNQMITVTNPEYFAINSHNKLEQSKIGEHFSQSPPKTSNEMEQLKQKQSQNTQMDSQIKDNHNSLENHRRRAQSNIDFVGSDSQREYRSWSVGQNVVKGSIQHKGQFYFVTGVCKTTQDSEMRQHTMSLCGSESGNELETYKLRERCHSTMENLFRPLQPSPCVLTSDDRSFVNVSKTNKIVSMCEENRQSLSQSSRSLEALEEIDVMQSRDIGRHTPNNPIFYCGPERTSPLQQTKEVAYLSNEQLKHVREEQAKRVNRQSLGDVASERINKKTTPLLYQLTGASTAGFTTKTGVLDAIIEPLSNNMAIDAACNTLDHSYKKFYRDQLKDVQSRVLRETSFKRRDLQLSRSHRVRERSDAKLALVQDARPTAVHQFMLSQDSETSTETLTPSITSEGTEKGSIKEAVEIESPKQVEMESENQNNRHANVAQPQVPRIRGRKRLTPEQKKMCFSEPEKLHQIGRGAVSHSSCRSFGNESENDFPTEQGADDSVLQTEPGFVAARRKVFETRGRALSASSALKTSLKHLQHKALVEYMERKTGQKVAEPQQPAPQVPATTRQRHSLGEKPFDWGPRPQSGSQESNKKRLNRPQSAGRILDSSTSSIRYAQFFSNQSSSGQSCGQLYQPKCRQSRGPSQGKSASVENLLDQPENRVFYRNRSTSSPHPFQAFEPGQDSLLVNDTKDTDSSQKKVAEESPGQAEAQQPLRRLTQRGKSMEELGATTFTRPKALSKSTEQLDHLCRHSTHAEPELEKRSTSKSMETVKNTDFQKEQQQQQQQITQGPTNQTSRKSPVKQNSEPILGSEDNSLGSRDSTTSPGPSMRTRIHSHGAVPNEAWSRTNSTDSPRGQEMKSSSSRSAQTKSDCESRPNPRTTEIEESMDDPASTDLPPPPPLSPNQEVCSVLPSEEQLKPHDPESTLTEAGSSESPVSAPPTKSPSTSVSDLDFTQQLTEEKTTQNNDENLDKQNLDLMERGSPEGETKIQEMATEKPEWEELVVALVKADQSLARTLFPLTNRMTALMLMEQLLSEDTLLMEEHYKKKQERRGESVEEVEVTETFTCPSSQRLDEQTKADVTEKKRLLVVYIEERLLSLADTRAGLQADIEDNRVCGEALQSVVRERCSPVELERYNLFMGDLERVLSLLLCLSARLARVQNALSTVDQHTEAEERESLNSRHRLLCKQRDDAKDLKDNLDRRESQVSAFLSRQLSPEQLQDYKRFVQTKASLLIQQKDLEERQRLGEEQLEALSHCLK